MGAFEGVLIGRSLYKVYMIQNTDNSLLDSCSVFLDLINIEEAGRGCVFRVLDVGRGRGIDVSLRDHSQARIHRC